MTPERIKELRENAKYMDLQPDGSCSPSDVLECLDEIDALRKRVEELEKFHSRNNGDLSECVFGISVGGCMICTIHDLREKLRVAKSALEKIMNNPEVRHCLKCDSFELAREALKEIEK